MNHAIEPAFHNNNIAIYLAMDNQYVPYLGITVYSLLKNAGPECNYDIIIAEEGVTDKNKEICMQLVEGKPNCSMRFINVGEFIKKLNVTSNERVSVSTYAKMFVVSDLFEAYDKMLVLDSDILVLKDISRIKDVELNGMPIAAVKDTYLPVSIKRGFHADKRLNYKPVKSCYEDAGLDPYHYFNSGVIWHDLKKCREMDSLDKIIKTCEKSDMLPYMEQDVLNLVFKDNWQELSFEWNGMSHYSIAPKKGDFSDDYAKNVETAVIMHFLGGNKPWQDKNAFWADLYMQYAKETVWEEAVIKARQSFEERYRTKNLLLPKGSKRRDLYYRLWYKLHDMKNGWSTK